MILYINEDSLEFLEKARLEEILNKYASFLPVPIKFGTKTTSVEDGVDEEGKPKYKSVEVDNIINNPTPAWTKSPNELSDEDYLNFYRELYPFAEDPLFWIHLNVDYPFNLTGILYFPKVKNDFDLQKNKIKLFSRQVFITDEVKDIVPEFLMLLHGVIDSPDIPLNVSRSFLQADSNVRKINTYITRKVADKLLEIFKADRKAYQEKWDDIGLFVKYGMLSDEKFAEKAMDFALVKNTEGEYFLLKEYAEKVKDLQKDKDGKIVYLYATDVKKQHSFIVNAEQKKYDVLVLDSPIDSHFVGFLEQKVENTSLKRVDADVIDELIKQESSPVLSLSEEESTSVKSVFEKAISKDTMQVEVAGLNEDVLPVTVTMDEFMRRMKEMAKTGAGMSFYGEMPDRYKVTVNGNHPLIKRVLAEENEEKKEQLAKQMYDLALLNLGLLQGEELTNFVKRSVSLID